MHVLMPVDEGGRRPQTSSKASNCARISSATAVAGRRFANALKSKERSDGRRPSCARPRAGLAERCSVSVRCKPTWAPVARAKAAKPGASRFQHGMVTMALVAVTRRSSIRCSMARFTPGAIP